MNRWRRQTYRSNKSTALLSSSSIHEQSYVNDFSFSLFSRTFFISYCHFLTYNALSAQTVLPRSVCMSVCFVSVCIKWTTAKVSKHECGLFVTIDRTATLTVSRKAIDSKSTVCVHPALSCTKTCSCMHVSSSLNSLSSSHSATLYGLTAVEPNLRDGMKWKWVHETKDTAMNE